MVTENAKQILASEAEAIKGTFVGYTFNLIMDYGNGRQVTIVGTLPLHATQKDFDAELDKLRVATNRQQSFVILRDREIKMGVARKMVAALEHMLASYDASSAEALTAYEKELEEEMAAFAKSNDKGLTIKHQQLSSMKIQASENLRKFKESMRVTRQGKTEELERQQAEIEICESIIAGCKAEIEG